MKLQYLRNQLMRAIASELVITDLDIMGKKSKHLFVEGRAIYAYLIEKHLKDTTTRIGKDINRKSADVRWLIQRCEDRISVKDARTMKVLNKVEPAFFG